MIQADGVPNTLHKPKPQFGLIPTTMVTYKFILILLLLTIVNSSCKQHKVKKQKILQTVVLPKINQDSLTEKLYENIVFFSDSLLKNQRVHVTDYLKKYQTDTCGILVYTNKELKEGFEGLKNIGDINGDKINDSVFVIPPFNFCDEGYSYSFLDPSLPRLFTDSYCCHPDNLFSIGDIDEDGVSEIGVFYSTCVSRYKSLIAYSLKNGQWEQVGSCGFDIYAMKPDKEKRVRKIGKGKFEMLEVVINNFEKRPSGDREWKQFAF